MFLPTLLLMIASSGATPWAEASAPFAVRADGDDGLRLTGAIRPGDEARFDAALRPTTRRLTVNSAGGAASAALAMAQRIEARGLTVVVDGICASSCANYLFAAGKLRIVRPGGLLLWHGAPDEASRAGMHAQLAAAMTEIGATPEQIAATRRQEDARLDGWIAQQDALYRRRRLNPAVLYDLNRGIGTIGFAADMVPMVRLSAAALRCTGFAVETEGDEGAPAPAASGNVRIVANPVLEAELCRAGATDGKRRGG